MTEPITQPGGNIAGPEEWQTDAGNAECFAFQSTMAERIGEGEDLQSHPHMATCERCRALVRELEEIAIVARQLMPEDAEPGEDLWTKIEKKLAMEEPQEEERVSQSSEAQGSGLSLEGGLAFEGGLA